VARLPSDWRVDPIPRLPQGFRRPQHVAQPADVAEVVTFLASDQARYVTAQVVHLH
jgi:NAD(P)-dependent dehydrogenase (short-subunit alcohol dehydrogenase family)